MRQHLLQLGIFVLCGCVGAIVGAYKAHRVESGRIAALQSELERTKGELAKYSSGEFMVGLMQIGGDQTRAEFDRSGKEAAARLNALYNRPTIEESQELVRERLREEILRAKYGDKKGKALYEADKAAEWEIRHPGR
jgi:hypothetical protein